MFYLIYMELNSFFNVISNYFIPDLNRLCFAGFFGIIHASILIDCFYLILILTCVILFLIIHNLEGPMAFKTMENSLGFADFALASSLKHNRSFKLMENIKNSIEWNRIEAILLAHYTAGTSRGGAKAYPPILLYKCLLLQKWFKIQSDTELENQINDRLSFKKFIDLSFSKPSPDKSTFSRFRKRLSKETFDQINAEIIRQFEKKGLFINEGNAVDARLVRVRQQPALPQRAL